MVRKIQPERKPSSQTRTTLPVNNKHSDHSKEKVSNGQTEVELFLCFKPITASINALKSHLAQADISYHRIYLKIKVFDSGKNLEALKR